MNLLSFLFKSGKKRQMIDDAKSRGAIFVDVRTPGEFSGGKIPGSKNIPLDKLPQQKDTIKKWNKPVIVVCASGMRSAAAKNLLAKEGIEVYNGGSWSSNVK